MRTSSQLERMNNCPHNQNTSLTKSSNVAMRSSAQKQIIRRLLEGEPMEDIAGEIDSILKERGYVWENYEQRIKNLNSYERRIRHYSDFEEHRRRDGYRMIFPADYDTTVDFYGEQVEAKPDYFMVKDNIVRVCRVVTGKANITSEDMDKYETYVLGRLGERLFPGKAVYVDRIPLICNNEGKKCYRDNHIYGTMDKDFEESISSISFNTPMKEYFNKKYEEDMENPVKCSSEECAGCPMNNICHFTEPPVALDAAESVRPLSEIRLTRAQRDIVEFTRGRARVNTGAGAGKTLVTAMRIVNMLENGSQPEDFCLLTFTKSGAEEMTARVMSYAASRGIAVDPERFTAGTINGFCQDIINEYYEDLGYTRCPIIIPDQSKYGIINDILARYPKIQNWEYTNFADAKYARWQRNLAIYQAIYMFNEIKRERFTKDNNPWNNGNIYSATAVNAIFDMYDAYEKELKNRCFIEYEDQIGLMDVLLEKHPDLWENKGFKHILIDEFQDTALKEIELLNKIMDTTHFESFMAVGDDSQSIFAFRHTSPEYMINFGNYFGNFTDFPLVENHRSQKAIIDFANKINEKALEKVEKDLIPTKEEAGAPSVQGYYTQTEEYKAVAKSIKKKWDAGEHDIAILASDKYELNKLADELTKLNIPSVLMNPIPYKENSRVAALCSFYEAFSGKGTQGFADYQNILGNGALKNANTEQIEMIAKTMQDEVKSKSASVQNFMEFAKQLDVQEIDACFQEFLKQVEFCRSEQDLNEFFENFKLYGDTSTFRREGKFDAVCITTIHSAKGLEWDTTYLTVSNLDKLQYHKKNYDFVHSGEHDEVIRKYFVGATRARKELIITGRYLVSPVQGKEGVVFNDCLKDAYEILGKPFDFNIAKYNEIERAEKAISQAEKAVAVHPILKDIIEKSKEAQKAREEEVLLPDADRTQEVFPEEAPTPRRLKPRRTARNTAQQSPPEQVIDTDIRNAQTEAVDVKTEPAEAVEDKDVESIDGY